ncbi:hypothetical protein M876_10710 [Elizabethkingia anophelis FMS-007]|nr:hypothetical protein M876_10710 [Elizabethkingia anophelis FMS-007]
MVQGISGKVYKRIYKSYPEIKAYNLIYNKMKV